MKRLFVIGAAVIGMAFAGSAMAADGAAIFKAKCSPCHGADGKGTAMAPAFTGNAFIKSSTPDQITEVIKKGRAGADKKYKQFAIAMPPQKLTDDEIKGVVDYLKSVAK